MNNKILPLGVALLMLAACGGDKASSTSSSSGNSSSSGTSSSSGNSSSSSSASSNSGSASSSSSSASSSSSSSSASSSSSSGSPTGKYMEWLNRGVVAVKVNNGVFLSWRLLGTDPQDISFNVYRNGTLVNGAPLTSVTNFVDADGTTNATYEIKAVINGREENAEGQTRVWSRPFHTINLSAPTGGTTPDGVAYTYEANDISVGDVDGDGEYEIFLKWDPTNAKDNAHSGYTGNVFIDAYKMSGQRLWRIDLGRNIRAGAHYTQFLVYDFDGDGKAELVTKTADGTRDAAGTVIGNANADYRNSSGYILEGPEYLTVFNGATGRILQTIEYPNARGTLSSWGDTYGNRMDRFLAGVAYLDGLRPSIIMSRGYYDKTMISALDWRNGQLTRRWTFTADSSQNQAYRGQGAHSLSIADVDNDGRHEIIFGSATIDDNGRGLYTTGLGHGDALHVADIIPSRPGLEVFMVHECPSCYGNHGVEVHDARTGQILYSGNGNAQDVGRGVAADIDPRYPGMEVWGSRNGLFTSTGQELSTKPGQMNFLVWWDGDLLRELLDGTTVYKWDYQSGRSNAILSAASNGAASNNGTKSTPGLSADLLGDWREEIIFRNSSNTQLQIYTTTIPTQHRLYTLMHDPQYRVAIAWQNVAYNQPPHPSFFLGEGMAAQPKPDINTSKGGTPDTPAVPSDVLQIQEGAAGFCSVAGILESVNSGFTGSGYANTDNAAGTSIRWAVSAPASGSYSLVWRYAGINDRPATVRINNSVVHNNLAFASTGAWSSWTTVTTNVNLNAGNNVIELVANAADGLGNIDWLQINNKDARPGNCP